MRVKAQGPDWSVEGTFVCVLKAGQRVSAHDMYLYYQLHERHSLYEKFSEAATFDRLVIQKDSDPRRYVMVPVIDKNKIEYIE